MFMGKSTDKHWLFSVPPLVISSKHIRDDTVRAFLDIKVIKVTVI